MNLVDLVRWGAVLQAEANDILSRVEVASARKVSLEGSYLKLAGLSVKQDDLFRQALRCIEHELYRAAHVMAWAAFMDWIHEALMLHKSSELRVERPDWKVRNAEDLRSFSDYQVIETAGKVGLLSRTLVKALHGLLNKRNAECAHPEDYYPGLNDSLGYMDELFKRLNHLKSRFG